MSPPSPQDDAGGTDPPLPPDRGLLVALAGPSGVGKGTVVERLRRRRPRTCLSLSVTTRAPRVTEVDGVHYRFVDDATFDAMIARDELLEWARVHSHRSGTPRGPVEEQLAEGWDVLLEIDVQGALAVRETKPEAVLVFLAPPSRAELTRRLVQRGTESEAELAVRNADAERELAAANEFDHVVVNDDVDRAAVEVASIIAGARG